MLTAKAGRERPDNREGLTRVLVRAVKSVDLPRIVSLDAVSQPSPWCYERFRTEFELEQSRITLAEIEGEVVGYLCAWDLSGEIEIQNIVTASNVRRRGVASALLDELLTHARNHEAFRLLLEVRYSNTPAVALYRRYGFVDSGVRRGYYADGEDALLMEKILSEV